MDGYRCNAVCVFIAVMLCVFIALIATRPPEMLLFLLVITMVAQRLAFYCSGWAGRWAAALLLGEHRGHGCIVGWLGTEFFPLGWRCEGWVWVGGCCEFGEELRESSSSLVLS